MGPLASMTAHMRWQVGKMAAAPHLFGQIIYIKAKQREIVEGTMSAPIEFSFKK